MKDSKYAYKCEVRSVLENSSRPTSTLWVNLMAKGAQVNLETCQTTSSTVMYVRRCVSRVARKVPSVSQ
jgi:hypothetical protein